ncbi:MAG TPA: DUF4416 family protein [Candidatus Binatia bacterium]|jgi:hypothetical protein
MGTPQEPQPVKLFIALLAAHDDLIPPVESDLSALFGPIDSASAIFPWSVTDYYQSEMGRALRRRFISFERLISPEALAEIKHKTHKVEDSYRRAEGTGRRRRVNIDPGYVDAGKVVLASTKGAGHRMYLQAGIYGETTLLFYEGSFHPFPYTYQDYLWPETIKFLADLRHRYLGQVKR